ncbi:CtsR family transcriptional regulator [Sesbania bispinosa]|nr:CtsR family transcriptional regulator [Sesbania bispinosa]
MEALVNRRLNFDHISKNTVRIGEPMKPQHYFLPIEPKGKEIEADSFRLPREVKVLSKKEKKRFLKKEYFIQEDVDLWWSYYLEEMNRECSSSGLDCFGKLKVDYVKASRPTLFPEPPKAILLESDIFNFILKKRATVGPGVIEEEEGRGKFFRIKKQFVQTKRRSLEDNISST